MHASIQFRRKTALTMGYAMKDLMGTSVPAPEVHTVNGVNVDFVTATMMAPLVMKGIVLITVNVCVTLRNRVRHPGVNVIRAF